MKQNLAAASTPLIIKDSLLIPLKAKMEFKCVKWWAYERIWPLQSAIGKRYRLDILAQLWTSWKKNGEIMIESAKASTTLNMCWDNMKAAGNLHKQWASLEEPCSDHSCQIFWVNTHRNVRTHLENSEQLSPHSANTTGPQSTASGIKESTRLSCGGVMLLTGLRGQRSASAPSQEASATTA